MKRSEKWKLPGYGLKDVHPHLSDKGERVHPGFGCRALYPAEEAVSTQLFLFT